MATPRPKLDLFTDSPCLVSKKCRTSTPSLRPPKPPMKSSKQARRSITTSSSSNTATSTAYTTTSVHDGSFSYGLAEQSFTDFSRLYQNFEILAKVGSGYFADVYKVKSRIDGQHYAIKKTSNAFTSNSDRLRKLQEVKSHQLLPPHPNCVRYYDFWEEDGYLYIQTELCKTSLNEILEMSEDHKLPEQTVWNYLHDLLLAVKHLHDHDLLHMDIKPDNIFISFDGEAKLGDFGLMRNCCDLNSSAMSTDDSGIINQSDESIDSIDEGDCKYLAKETMQGKFTKAADIFSLGITIFEVASGLELPQRGETYHKLRHNEIDGSYFNGLSQELINIIKMMMEEDYLRRPCADVLLAYASKVHNKSI